MYIRNTKKNLRLFYAILLFLFGGGVCGKMRCILYAVFIVCLYKIDAAFADVASAEYVREIVNALNIQSDWNQTDSTQSDYIKNKPDIPSPDSVEYSANKVNEISSNSTDVQYPSAHAVYNALKSKADVNDIRFNTIPTSQPTGAPPTGQVFIWFN